MHCVFSYYLGHVENERRTQIEAQIEDVLSHYNPHVRRLTNFYIVHLHGRQEWDSMLLALTQLSNSFQGVLQFIMSPLMDGGRYNGMLPRGEWSDINSLTELQD